MASILDTLLNAAKKAVQTSAKQIVSPLVSWMNPQKKVEQAKPMPVAKSLASRASSYQEPLKVSPSYTPNTSLGKLKDSTNNQASYQESLRNKPIPGTLGSLSQAAYEDIRASDQKADANLESRIKNAKTEREKQAIVKGNLGLSSLPSRILNNAPAKAAAVVGEFLGPVSEAGRRVSELAYKPDSSSNNALSRALAVGNLGYEGAKVYGATAAKAPSTLQALSKPAALSTLTNLLPEDQQKLARPALEAYSVARSPEKLVGGLNVLAGRATDPISNYINTPGNLNPVAKDAANLGLNLLENFAAVKGGKAINKTVTKYKPSFQSGVEEFRKTGNVESALDAATNKQIQLDTLDRARTAEASNVPAVGKVLGYTSPEQKGVVPKNVKQLVKADPLENSHYKELVETGTAGSADDIAAAKAAQKTGIKDLDVTKLKDLPRGAKGFDNFYSNLKSTFGNEFHKVEPLLKDFDTAKGKDYVNFIKGYQDKVQSEVVGKLGIKKGSKESAAVQKFGEGLITLEEVQKQFPKKWQNIIEADQFFRKNYDEILPQINKSVAEIYPTRPDKLVPARSNYYRHYNEQAKTGLGRALQIARQPQEISSDLTGISAFTKPKTKWASFKQKRTGEQTTYDAVGGFQDYLPQASYAVHVDKFIPKFRALSQQLAAVTADGTPYAGKVNKTIEFIEHFANDLAGKTNPYDRSLQEFAGRKALALVTALNSQVKANAILGNLSSTVAQFGNLPYGLSKAGVINSTKGLASALSSIITRNHPINQSAFINERYATNLKNRFDTGILANTKRAAEFITGVGDEIATRGIWSAMYEKGKSKGVEDPVRFADVETRQVVAGRGIGEQPIFMKSKVAGLVAPFQLEVGNLWNNLNRDLSEREFGTLLKYAIAASVFNQGAIAVRGTPVTFDPGQALYDAYNIVSDESKKGELGSGIVKGIGRVTGELLSSMPLGQQVATGIPEYGVKNIFGTGLNLPTRKEILGKSDPTRFGTGFQLGKFLDPYSLLPFGGQQVKKTVEGTKAVLQGYKADSSGNAQYPIENNVLNLLKGATLGVNSLPETKDYYENNQRPLSDKDTESLKYMSPAEKTKFYDTKQAEREQSAKEDDLREQADKEFKKTNFDPAKVVEIRKQFTLEKAKISEKELQSAKKKPMYEGLSDAEITEDLSIRNKVSAYKAFNDRLIDMLTEYGKNPANREVAKSKIKDILNDEERIYNEEDEYATRRLNSLTRVKEVWESIK